jgi:hypothetical protein
MLSGSQGLAVGVSSELIYKSDQTIRTADGAHSTGRCVQAGENVRRESEECTKTTGVTRLTPRNKVMSRSRGDVSGRQTDVPSSALLCCTRAAVFVSVAHTALSG